MGIIYLTPQTFRGFRPILYQNRLPLGHMGYLGAISLSHLIVKLAKLAAESKG